MDEEEEETEEI